ncbi:MAG: AmmeMemoRadiSam system protein B [Candidatus Omnitrophica bacterium]|nr:AmmeMemoRadiSam system protein B [Candidatus Omnitrophota bacterium]
MVRVPAVAGRFYPEDKESLEEELNLMFPTVIEKTKAIGAIVPHAGYMYSGKVAGAVYARLLPKSTYIIISPNHTGVGSRFSLSEDLWQTPMGTVSINRELLDRISDEAGILEVDPTAHAAEHSIEVQLPFLQRISPGFDIVPLTVRIGNVPELKKIAESIAKAINDIEADAMIIASSDMSHYESRETTEYKDKIAIDRILDLDAEGLIKVVEEKNISMCGYIPSAIMLLCAKNLGAKTAELVEYSDSGYVSGETDQVVGYAGVIVS